MEEARIKISISESPEFTSEIAGIHPNDPVHFTQMNNIIEKLLENDGALKKTMDEVFLLGNENKNGLVENLVAMGIDASTDETWGQLIDKVLAMTNTSGDTVTPAVLLAGYTAHDATGKQITGDMPEMAAVTVEATTTTQDDSYTYLGLPAGHYDESSKVRTKNSNIGPTPAEGGLPFCIESVSMSHNASSDDTRHTYAPVYVTIKWLKSCTISGVSYSGGTSQPGGGLSIGEINGYHAKGSTTTFSGNVDSAYSAGSCGVTFNYANAKVVYS